MKKMLTLGAAIVSAAFLSNVVHAAVAQSGLVGVGAVVSESPSTLDIRVLDIATGDVAANVNFGSPSNAVPVWSTLAPNVVEIKVVNANSWELKTYTDNFAGVPPTDQQLWGTQYGGMIDAAKVGKKVGMGWALKTSRVPATDVTVGNPSDGKINGFTYLKDKSDQDDPATVGADANEGFDMGSGYINVAFGGYTETNIVIPTKTDPVTGGFAPTLLANPGDPFFCYFEGNFSGASAATYETTVHFDLVNL
jgi:hypothetical protein